VTVRCTGSRSGVAVHTSLAYQTVISTVSVVALALGFTSPMGLLLDGRQGDGGEYRYALSIFSLYPKAISWLWGAIKAYLALRRGRLFKYSDDTTGRLWT
jgi:hypothetical protein